jgi:hypothetical protein
LIIFIIRLNKFDCKVICVLEDLILLEYLSDANIQKKMMTVYKWIETDKINEIVALRNLDE